MQESVAIFAPSGRDAKVIAQILQAADTRHVTIGPHALMAGIADASIGAALVTEDALLQLSVADLRQALRDQPPWSDFPFVVLTAKGAPATPVATILRAMGNITRIERPAHPAPLVAAVRAALRARLRQRDAERYLAERERAEQQLRALASSLEQRVIDRTRALAESNVRLSVEMAERIAAQEHMNQLQAELIHVSRVSAMGTMASTLAHELNQPLTAVVNYVRGSKRLLAAEGREVAPEILNALDAAADSARRAGDILRHLRDLVARGEVQRDVEDLPSLTEAALTLGLVDANAPGVTCRRQYDPQAATVLADRIQIQQVLVNLIRNAVEAMRSSERREITVASRRCADGMVEISVADTGPGLTAAILKALFSPFNSTKPDGMGIGLSISRTIVEANGGSITGENLPAGGAVFRFTLPAGEDDEEDARIPASG